VRYLTVNEVLDIYQRVIQQSGGAIGIRDLGALESSVAQPRATFAERDLYPAIVDKASALGFSIIQNHPFLDGNKRAGHAAMEVFLILNGFEVRAPVEEQERVILSVASGAFSRDSFREWLARHIKPIYSEGK
jgi:death-on-curing protein